MCFSEDFKIYSGLCGLFWFPLGVSVCTQWQFKHRRRCSRTCRVQKNNILRKNTIFKKTTCCINTVQIFLFITQIELKQSISLPNNTKNNTIKTAKWKVLRGAISLCFDTNKDGRTRWSVEVALRLKIYWCMYI